ncbi:MAG: HEAT repeat domain-containing protein [bacterium]|nr:HEAT repeat domain-containing protein [bacterium]
MSNVTTSSNQPIPSYSGVTINVTNPAMAISPDLVGSYGAVKTGPQVYQVVPVASEQVQIPQQAQMQSYPAQYYMNTYNIPQNTNGMNTNNNEYPIQYLPAPQQSESYQQMPNAYGQFPVGETSQNIVSNGIISTLDERAEEQKELEKNGKKKQVKALTNEYIMSLENYLNNPNTDIRMMAAKEILTRFDEDRNRYDDAALNALLNKMLQDPAKLVRIAALSALSSDLASGNDYTMKLLDNIQRDPQSDPEDVLEASQIMLNRTSITEDRYFPQ